MTRAYPHDRPFLTTTVEDGHLFLRVRQSTILGYVQVPHMGIFDITQPTSTSRRARTISGGRISNTITSSALSLCIFIEKEQPEPLT